MVVDSIDGHRGGKLEEGEKPLSSTIFSFDVENELVDAWRVGQTRLARPRYQARAGAENITRFPSSADQRQGSQS